jgi:hypothetical protein
MADRDALDLFGFLGQLNRRDPLAYDKLTEEAQKVAHPLVIMRWLSGTRDPAQVIALNERANRYVFSLGTEKPLLFKLLAASCTGRTGRASWLKGPGSNNAKLTIQAIMAKYECSEREAREYVELLDDADIVTCAEDAGWDKDQVKKLQVELKK